MTFPATGFYSGWSVAPLTGNMKSSAKFGFVTFLLALLLKQVPAYSTWTKLRHWVNQESLVFQSPSTLPISRISLRGIASFHPDWRSKSKFWITERLSLWILLSIYRSYCWVVDLCVHCPLAVGVCSPILCLRVEIRLGSFQLLKISLLGF